ncbi:hypothetical protein PV325_002570 [Microctonus aethiopoides]|nr:hypothetical protein PV325_002570 [Microctonus aethiopoides]
MNYNESEISERINTWTSNDKQNVWELSGLFEGDIILNNEKATRNGVIDAATRWPNGTIPYLIRDNDFDDEEITKIHEAIKEFHEKTCLLFRNYEEKIDSDYLIFQSNMSGCWSSVGKQGKSQLINLQTPNCLKHGTIIHEIMHAVGFYHQQSTFDRDDYVKIHWENIKNGKEHNFNKYDDKTVTDFNVGYDYSSVMHYSSRAFSKNDEPTITPIKHGIEIGQRNEMSEKDQKKLQAMYKNECNNRIGKNNDNDSIIDIINFFPSFLD